MLKICLRFFGRLASRRAASRRGGAGRARISRTGAGPDLAMPGPDRGAGTARSARKDPTAQPDAGPREAVEIRTLAFFWGDELPSPLEGEGREGVRRATHIGAIQTAFGTSRSPPERESRPCVGKKCHGIFRDGEGRAPGKLGSGWAVFSVAEA